MKLFISVLVLVFMAASSYADTVTLKAGGVVFCKIDDCEEGQLRMRSPTGSQFGRKISDIRAVEISEPRPALSTAIAKAALETGNGYLAYQVIQTAKDTPLFAQIMQNKPLVDAATEMKTALDQIQLDRDYDKEFAALKLEKARVDAEAAKVAKPVYKIESTTKTAQVKCPNCGGDGKVKKKDDDKDGGTSTTSTKKCSRCDGEGTIESKTTTTIKKPVDTTLEKAKAKEAQQAVNEKFTTVQKEYNAAKAKAAEAKAKIPELDAKLTELCQEVKPAAVEAQ